MPTTERHNMDAHNRETQQPESIQMSQLQLLKTSQSQRSLMLYKVTQNESKCRIPLRKWLHLLYCCLFDYFPYLSNNWRRSAKVHGGFINTILSLKPKQSIWVNRMRDLVNFGLYKDPKVWVSIPPGDSECFLCPTLVTRRKTSV